MYTIWVPFELAPSHDFDLDEPMEFEVCGYPSRLVRQLGHAGLSVEGLPDEDTARAVLPRVNAALLYAIVSWGYSMRFEWEPVPVVYKEGDPLIYWEVSRIDPHPQPFNASRPVIHQSDKRLTDTQITVSLDGKRPPHDFLEAFQRGLGEPGLRDGITDPALKLSGDLYVLSQFEASDNAKFLTLCTALEVLAPRLNRPETVCVLIDQWMQEARELAGKAGAGTKEFKALQSLDGGLKNLKTISITASLKECVRDTLSRDSKFKADADEKAGEVVKLYRLRSSVIHGGDAVGHNDLNTLDVTVRKTLVAAMKSQATGKVPSR